MGTDASFSSLTPRSVFDRVARLAVDACRADWAAVYVDANVVATAEAEGAHPAHTLFADLDALGFRIVTGDEIKDVRSTEEAHKPRSPRAYPPSTDALASRRPRTGEAPASATAKPPVEPHFWAVTSIPGLSGTSLCVAGSEPREGGERLHETLSSLADLVLLPPDLLATLSDTASTAPLRRRPGIQEHAHTLGQHQAPLAFVEWDAAQNVVDWNPSAEHVFGYTRREARTLRLPDLIASVDRASVRASWSQASGGEQGFSHRSRNLTKDGRVIVCEWHNTPLLAPDGTVEGMISLVHDVTDREAQARAIRESKEFAENLIVSMQDGVVVFDPSGTAIQVNDAFCEITAFTREDLMGSKLPYPFWPPEEYDTLRAAFKQVAAGAEQTFELTFQRRDGTRFPVLVRPSPMRDETGRVVSYVTTVQDITEKRATERGLAREQDLQEKIFDAIPVMIVVYDAEDGELRINRAFEEIIGAGTAHLPGMRLDLEAGARVAMRAFVDALPETWTDIPVVFPDGRSVKSSWIGVRGGGGMRFGIGIDITERARRAEALKRARDEAETMNQLKTAFLANMSHEIRTPLTSILGFSEAIREALLDVTHAEQSAAMRCDASSSPVGADPLSAAADFAQRIERGGQRLLETLNSVLDLSRLEAGMMTLTPDRLDLTAEVKDTVNLLRPQAAKAGVDIHVRARADAEAEVDPVALHRVLNNVIGNALKFTPPGGQVLCHVHTVREGVSSGSRIVIEDDGVGISKDFFPRIFRPFEQESSGIGRTYEGSGLGLAVTSQLLDLMGGTIEIASEKGRGTRVTLSFPDA